MNKVFLHGRITRDINLKISPKSGKSYLFNTIAVDEYSKKEQKKIADFFRFVAYGKTAEALEKYCAKGGRIIIEGSLKNSKYEKDGVKRISTEVVVQKLSIIDFKTNSETSSFKDDMLKMIVVEDDIPEEFIQEVDFLSIDSNIG